VSDEKTATGPLAGRDRTDPAALTDGIEKLGVYRILQKLGEGGMSAVYLAARDDDAFRKRVAVKVIRPELRSEGMLHRFRQERQILASLEHENIARLLDGGSADGVPYFVMEYVEGQPIGRYCEVRKLSIDERLHLFRTVCAAVQFAHQNLVVHRDIKPSNILITTTGVPKLVDFGIAKLLNPELAADELAPTRFDTRIMTPEYASPEQIRGEPITTASDLYSLGVLLFELLTGHRPYPVAQRSLEEISRVITESDVPRPSTVLFREDPTGSRHDGRSSGDLQRLRRRLTGDLDNIVLMALRKEPQRRYASAQQFADDIGRHLARLPVIARRDTFGYRAGKFVRRHRWGVAAGGLLVALLIAFASAMTVQSIRLQVERDRSELARRSAERETAKAQAINRFLRELLASAGPLEGIRRDVTVAEALSAAEKKARETLADQPEVQAGVLDTIGATFFQEGRVDEGERLIRAALEIRRRIPGPPTADLAESLTELGRTLEDLGKYVESEAALREALAIRARIFGDESLEVAETTGFLAETLRGMARFDEAERVSRQALAIRRKILGEDDPRVAEALMELGVLLDARGEFPGAVEALAAAVPLQRRLLPPEHTSLAVTLSSLGIALMHKGDLDAAEPPLREALAIRRKKLASDHPDIAQSLNNLAGLLRRRGEFAAAEPMYEECLAILRKIFGSDHPNIAGTLGNLATLEKERGDLDAAERWIRQAIPMHRRLRGPDHPLLANALSLHASILEKRGDAAGAAPLHMEAVGIYERSMGADNPKTVSMRLDYAACLVRLKRPEEAERQLRSARDALLKAPRSEENDKSLRGGLERLADLYDAVGNHDEAAGHRATLAELESTGQKP